MDFISSDNTEVSIHASVKDATSGTFINLNKRSFNPRICKRCDDSLLPKWLTYRVSIHASVKDATRKDEILSNPSLVSIHASVKDATMPMMFPIQTKMFQSTHL